MGWKTVKICSKCRIEKSLNDFAKDKQKSDGYYPSCKKCKPYVVPNRPHKARYDKEYRKTLGFKKAANQYKVTVTFLEEMLTKQNSKCAICLKAETAKSMHGGTMRLAIDHCHSSNRIRGFLCSRCNLSIGLAKDNPETLERAAQYLRGEL